MAQQPDTDNFNDDFRDDMLDLAHAMEVAIRIIKREPSIERCLIEHLPITEAAAVIIRARVEEGAVTPDSFQEALDIMPALADALQYIPDHLISRLETYDVVVVRAGAGAALAARMIRSVTPDVDW